MLLYAFILSIFPLLPLFSVSKFHMPTNMCFITECKQWPHVLRTPPVSSGSDGVDIAKATEATKATRVERSSALEQNRDLF